MLKSIMALSDFMNRTTTTQLDIPYSKRKHASCGLASSNCSLAFGPLEPVSTKTLPDAFALSVKKYSVHTALEYIDSRISYGTLDNDASILAKSLITYGIGNGARVCLLAGRGVHFVIGALAILKTGASYIPLDGNITTEHQLQFILNDAKPALLLSSRHVFPKASRFTDIVRVAILEDLLCSGYNTSPNNNSARLERKCAPSDEAYVIYTSGTTGNPKGVSVSHKNIINLICSPPGHLNISPGVRVGQVLNIAFDMCVWEIFACLLNGGTLVIRSSSSMDEWRRVMRSVDVFITTPSILAKYNPSDFPNIRTIATAGEPCSQQLADQWAASRRFYNCYGPTEVTVVNTMHEHIVGNRICIGKPTPNNSVYVLDEDCSPVPVESPGMIWAGGLGISSGYVNLPALTDARFRVDPFSSISSIMYNTGDLGLVNQDGTITHLGRIDDQVKVKGFRVELDGVAAAISSCPGVTMSCAIVTSDILYGFYSPPSVPQEIVKETVTQRLPYYANPSYYFALDALPLTENGKIDKKTLRGLVEMQLIQSY